MIIIFFCFHLNCTLAACDGRSNSPAFDFPVPGEPTEPGNGLPQAQEEAAPRIPPEVPRLDQPLMADAYRSVELQQRLSVHFIGRHDAAHLRPFLAILEKQMLLETRIEAALVADGYDPLSILDRRNPGNSLQPPYTRYGAFREDLKWVFGPNRKKWYSTKHSLY